MVDKSITRHHVSSLLEGSLQNFQESTLGSVKLIPPSSKHNQEIHESNLNEEVINDNDKLNCKNAQSSIKQNNTEMTVKDDEDYAVCTEEDILNILLKYNQEMSNDDFIKLIIQKLSSITREMVFIKKGSKRKNEIEKIKKLITILRGIGCSAEIISEITGINEKWIGSTISKMVELYEIPNVYVTKKIATPDTKLRDLLGKKCPDRALVEINYEELKISILTPLPVNQ